MVGASVANLPSHPFGEGAALETPSFLGTPVIASKFGLLAVTLLLRGKKKLAGFNEQMHESVRTAAPNLIITGAGTWWFPMRTTPISGWSRS
ncbi:hypothetical protein [Glutamicibacter arilaitensis]|uniref:hypothetical protein n=1 Tax=Glutamicibacter arilaitensis TaxID=256701 RepID=UPI00384ACD93